MKARLVRLEQSEQGALGVLLLDGIILACALQPDQNDKTRYYIPAGEYVCRRFHGTKWPNTFEILVTGHTALLFHAGNVESESLGCVLLGSSFSKLKGQRAVINSGATFREFLEATKSVDEFPLKVEDCYE